MSNSEESKNVKLPTIIEQMIRDEAKLQREAVSVQEQEVKDKLAVFKANVTTALGDIWKEMEPFAKIIHEGEYTVSYGHKDIRVIWEVNLPGLEQFHLIVCKPDAVTLQVSTSDNITLSLFGGKPSDYDAFAEKPYTNIPPSLSAQDRKRLQEFLMRMRQKWLEKEREKKDKLWDSLYKQLTGKDAWQLPTEEEAKALVVKLCGIYPGKGVEAEKGFAIWQMNEKALTAQRKAQEERNRKEEERKKIIYDEVKAWRNEYDRIRNENRQKLQPLFDRLNEPITLYKITYGVFVRDEEGEVIDTKDFYSIFPDQDVEAFFCKVERDGSKSNIRVFHPVSVEKKETDIKSHFYSRNIEVTEADTFLYYPLHMTPEEARKKVDALDLTPLPSHHESKTIIKADSSDIDENDPFE